MSTNRFEIFSGSVLRLVKAVQGIKAQKMADICAEKGWETISMANDWVTIYGDGVSVK